MPARPKRRAVRWLAAGVVVLALVGGAVAVADPDSSGPAARGSRRVPVGGARVSAGNSTVRPPSGAVPECGAASTQTVATVDYRVAQRIYTGEIHSREVRADIAHVTGSQELLSALASSNAQAVQRVVGSIVYTPH